MDSRYLNGMYFLSGLKFFPQKALRETAVALGNPHKVARNQKRDPAESVYAQPFFVICVYFAAVILLFSAFAVQALLLLSVVISVHLWLRSGLPFP
ncbi:MAG: hypothetical protein V3V10_05810 [Planctomycetota bacterium]